MNKLRTSSILLVLVSRMLICDMFAQDVDVSMVTSIVNDVNKRAQSGQIEALDQLKNLPPESALAALQQYISPHNNVDPKLQAKAVELVKSLKLESVYERRLNEESARQSDGVNGLIEQLSIVKTRAAVRIIARFLYDDRQPLSDDDVIYIIYSHNAVRALGEFNFADAPTKTSKTFYTRDEIDAWKRWWEANHKRFE